MRLSQALVHFLIDLANLFPDHRMSGFPIRAKYKHFRTIWEHTCDNSPTDYVSSSLKWWSSMHGVNTLKSCWVVLFANSQYRTTHVLAWPSISLGHEEKRKFPEYGNFSVLKRGSSRFKHGSVTFHNIFAYFTIFSTATQVYTLSQKDVGSPKATSSFNTFLFGFFPANFMSSTHTIKNNPFSRYTKRHSQFQIFSQPCFKRMFSKCRSHNSPAKRWPYKFFSIATTVFSILDNDFKPFVSW